MRRTQKQFPSKKLGVIVESDEVKAIHHPLNAGVKADVSGLEPEMVAAIRKGLDTELDAGMLKLKARATVARRELEEAGDQATLQQKRAAQAADWELKYFSNTFDPNQPRGEHGRWVRSKIAKAIKAVRKAVRIAQTQKRGTQEVLSRGKYRIDMDYGRPGTLDSNIKDDGYGSAHLDYQHSPEELHHLPITLARGSIHPHEDPKKLYVVHGDHVAVLTAQKRNDGSFSHTRYGLTTHYKAQKEAGEIVKIKPALIEGR